MKNYLKYFTEGDKNQDFFDILASFDPSGNQNQIKNESEVKDIDFEKVFSGSDSRLYR